MRNLKRKFLILTMKMDKIALIIEELKREEEEDIIEFQKINGIILEKREEFSDKKILFLNSQIR